MSQISLGICMPWHICKLYHRKVKKNDSFFFNTFYYTYNCTKTVWLQLESGNDCNLRNWGLTGLCCVLRKWVEKPFGLFFTLCLALSDCLKSHADYKKNLYSPYSALHCTGYKIKLFNRENNWIETLYLVSRYI